MLEINDRDAFLLGSLSEASLNTENWGKFLDEYVKHFNLNACHIMVVNDTTHATRFHIEAGVKTEEKYIESYVNEYIKKDLIMMRARISDEGKFYITNLSDDTGAYYTSAYYKNWVSPQKLKEGGAATIFSDHDWRCLIVHNRTESQGLYTQDEAERMEALLPHIGRAVKVSYIRESSEADHSRVAALVDGYRVPVVILTEYGEIWTMNNLMKDLIKENNDIFVENNSLRLKDKADDRLFTTGIFNAIKEKNGIQLGLANSINVNNAVFTFKAISNLNSEGTTSCGVIIYAISKQYRSYVSEKTLRDVFALTPAEANLCGLLMRGNDLNAIASMEKKSIYTVREQLSSAFKKTGCNSQSSLINMLASIPNFDS